MSDIEETIRCPNCKLDILPNNFTIHHVHCERNFHLCCKCEQPVKNDNRDEHENENHVNVQCNSCNLELEKCHLQAHLMNDCPNRKIKCQFCDIDVRADDLIEHEYYCGSRTEKCLECGEFVMLKYKSLHLDSNHTFIKLSDEPGPSPSWQYGKRTLCNFIPDLSSRSFKPVSFRKRRSNETLRKSRNSGSSESKDDSDEISKRNLGFLFSDRVDDVSEPKAAADDFGAMSVRKSARRDADEWPVLSGLRSLEISEDSSASPRASDATQTRADKDSDLWYAIRVSNEINPELWNKDVNVQDEFIKNWFKPLSGTDLSTEKSIEKEKFENNIEKVREEGEGVLKNDFNYSYDKQESVKLPCEFCGQLIVSNNLILHQKRCSLHKRDSYKMRGATHKMTDFDEDMEKKIACGVCNKIFKLSLLENHQLHCQRNSSKSPKSHSFSKNFKSVNMKSQPGLQNGVEPSSPQLSRMGTRSEWLSGLSKNSEGRDKRENLNHQDSGVVTRVNKVSRKSRRAPSPPAR